MREDLLWWWLILHNPQLNGVSLGYFNALPPPDVVVEMDASDFGLCALDVLAKTALTYTFTPSERKLIADFKTGAANGFDINFREPLSCAFAVHAWGERWSTDSPIGGRPRHVHFRIDNSSGVAWQNKLALRNPRAQVIIRLLSWWETSYRLRFSASHIAGSENTRADAGSRIPANPSFAAVFASLTPGWSQVVPTADIQGLATFLRAHSVADSTFDQYNRAFNRWRRRASRRGISPWLHGMTLTDKVQHISDFVLHGFQFGFGSGGPIRSDSIMAVLHGVRHFFAAS